jgi:hypothetical protein
MGKGGTNMARPRKDTRYFVVFDRSIVHVADSKEDAQEFIADDTDNRIFTVIVGEEFPVSTRVVFGEEKRARKPKEKAPEVKAPTKKRVTVRGTNGEVVGGETP